MKKIKKIFKIMVIGIIGIIGIVVVGGFLFMNYNPEFGGKPTEAEKVSYGKTGHYKNGIFINQVPASLDMSAGNIIKVMSDFIKGNPNRQPDFELPVDKLDSLEIVHKPDSLTRITWFGHSTFLLEIDGKNILIDPVFSERPSPISFMGSKRYSKELPIEIEKLPNIDAVIISHDHYDHLDYESIIELKDIVNQFYMPLAVGPHLREWGVENSKINELDWWEETEFSGLKFVCTPAQHFSGRSLTDRSTTLWASWVIEGNDKRIYFSGDSGYGSHFKQIGEKYGPFDFAMMECGQYNEKWEAIHMMPEQSVKAAVDIQSKLMMPIHWGAFTLALHSWTDPVERATKTAEKLGIPITTPKIGEPIILNDPGFPQNRWWEK